MQKMQNFLSHKRRNSYNAKMRPNPVIDVRCDFFVVTNPLVGGAIRSDKDF